MVTDRQTNEQTDRQDKNRNPLAHAYGTPNATKIQNVIECRCLSDCRSGEIDYVIDCRSGEIDCRSNVIDCRFFERLSFWWNRLSQSIVDFLGDCRSGGIDCRSGEIDCRFRAIVVLAKSITSSQQFCKACMLCSCPAIGNHRVQRSKETKSRLCVLSVYYTCI